MKKIDFNLFGIVTLFGFLLYFAQTRDFGLMFDGLTYSALAKHMLSTGEWNVLHYSARQYTTAYYHPPLAFWIQAFIYKSFGSAEYISRIFPATCALLSTVGVFWFTRARFGLTAAFWASIALITSTRFIKWGTNFYLDGITGFFVFTSFILWLWTLSEKNEKPSRDYFLTFVAGLFFTAAFMTKGVMAFPFGIAILISLFLYFRTRSFILFLFFILGSVLPLLLWFQLGNGLFYLENYFQTSAFGHGQELCFQSWQNIKNVWIPWWPIFVISLFYTLKKFLKREMVLPLMGAAALSLPMALTLNSHYFEHYMTAFYPFAAVLVGVQISEWIKKDYTEKYFKYTLGICLVVSILLATIAPNVNKQKDIPSTLWLREIRTMPISEQQKIKLIVYSKESAELWLNLAAILSRTDWQAIGEFSLNEPIIEGAIFVVKKGEVPNPAWEKIPQLYVEGYDFYGPKGVFNL